MAAENESTIQQPVPGPSGGTTHYRFEPFVPTWVLVALCVFAILGVRRAYSKSTRALMPEMLFALALMRFGAFALLLLCLARPIVISDSELIEKGQCFIALDSSTSMNLKDTAKGRSRWAAARNIFNVCQDDIKELNSKFELHRYLFDSSPREIPLLPGEPAPPSTSEPNATGTSTDITSMLEKLAVASGGMKSAGALLISDGRHNLPSDVVPAALALGRIGVPVYCVGLGLDATPTDFKDVRIRQLTVPDKAFVGGRTVIRVEIESTLRSPASAPLTVDVDGVRIFEQEVNLEPGVNKIAEEIEVPYTPTVIGLHRATANIAPLQDEANILNNTATAFFRVYRTKIGVWYVEGAIRKEFGAIRGALETAPNITLKAINAFSVNTSTASELLPSRPEDWGQIKLVIIGDLSAARFDDDALRQLTKFVADGGSVLMIGGRSNMGEGHWQDTALAEAFPVEFASTDGMEEGPLTINVMPGSEDHSILNIGNSLEQNLQLWRKLPPLPGVNRIRERKPAAEVLLKAGDRELLVVQNFGKGRSAVFTGDMTWQWILKGNQAETHRKFWRNLVTWLTRSDYRDSEKCVLADAEQLQYQVGDEALFHAHVSETQKFKEIIKTAPVKMTLTRLQGNSELPVFDEFVGKGPGEFAKRFALGAPGNYRFKASALGKDNAVLDSDSVDLLVTAPDIETDNPRANLKLLRRVAELSGGAFFDANNAPQAFKALLERNVGFSRSTTEVKDLWNNYWMLSIFFLLLFGEWALRKKWGLI